MIISLNFHGNTANYVLANGPTTTITANISCWPVVNDEIRGYYSFVNGHWRASNKMNNCERLALIVESPHKDEFDAIFNPIAPLNGRSGLRFSNNITRRLDKWLPHGTSNGNIEIIIINPIQYQTSLYHFLNGMIPYNYFGNYNYIQINPQLRNCVWVFLFNQCNMKMNFIRRMRRYNCDYIINCCTGKSYYKTFGGIKKLNVKKTSNVLKSLVRNELYVSNIIKSRNYLEDSHPVVW